MPNAADAACIDTAAGGAVRADGLSVRSFALRSSVEDPPLELTGDVRAGPMGGTGAIVLSGQARIIGSKDYTDLTYGSLTVAAGSEAWADTLVVPRREPGSTDVRGTLHLLSASSLRDVRVRAGGRLDSAVSYLQVTGALDIEDGGALVASGGSFATTVDTRLVGSPPVLRDINITHEAPFPLTVTGDIGNLNVRRGATLEVRPEGSRLSIEGLASRYSELPPPIEVSGTLDVEGVPGDGASGLPHGPITARIVNTGTLRLKGVQLEGGLDNQGTAQVSGSVWVKPDQDLLNSGRLEVGSRFGGAGPLGASLLVSGRLHNTGSIVGTDPTAEVSAERYDGAGSLDAWLNVISDEPESGFVVDPGASRTVPVLGLGQSRSAFQLGGLTEAASSRVVATRAVLDFGAPLQLDVGITEGFVPCAGSRWQLVSWPQLLLGWRPPSATPAGNVAGVVRRARTLSASGLPAGVTLHLEERGDAFVAVASGTPSSGATCSDTVGTRLVSGFFVEGLGRPASAAQLASLGARAATEAGRKAVAREVLNGAEGATHQVREELRRILGRPASAAGVASYTARFRSGVALDALRAEVYGDTSFWNSAGATVDGWAKAFYRVELGRAPTSAELATIRKQVAGGAKRVTLARFLLAGVEADRALAGRQIALWWARPSTAAERVTWGGSLPVGLRDRGHRRPRRRQPPHLRSPTRSRRRQRRFDVDSPPRSTPTTTVVLTRAMSEMSYMPPEAWIGDGHRWRRAPRGRSHPPDPGEPASVGSAPWPT
ncbi:hypothetical protein KSP35_16340 [Aquihabitans sp. G128]|uniref:hypothetical protein n=1 Tax=Aquihabitans sp. G128 TaxID=2849779 RepID=UPI001C23C583|nr:hypothetical protein [Aquihabitans sp. G128]QXC59933.1 hypothetical protein KSP35_16340 [Aquihabitans sp. G128]